MFLILPKFEVKTCFLITTNNVQDRKIIINVFFNIFIVCYLKFDRNNVSVSISDPPLSPVLQFCRRLSGFSVLDSCWLWCFLLVLANQSARYIIIIV